MHDSRSTDGVWIKDAVVRVEPDGSGVSGWAVLEVHPRNVPFRVGWFTHQVGVAEFYSDTITPLDAKFAMRVDNEPVWFVVRPVEGRDQLVVELVDLTTEDDPKYTNVPRY